MEQSWPDVDRRNPQIPDRRGFLRGGRRATDPPYPVACTRCNNVNVANLGLGASGIWCECRKCGHVWPLDPKTWRRPAH